MQTFELTAILADRDALETGDVTDYRLAQITGIAQSMLTRFWTSSSGLRAPSDAGAN